MHMLVNVSLRRLVLLHQLLKIKLALYCMNGSSRISCSCRPLSKAHNMVTNIRLSVALPVIIPPGLIMWLRRLRTTSFLPRAGLLTTLTLAYIGQIIMQFFFRYVFQSYDVNWVKHHGNAPGTPNIYQASCVQRTFSTHSAPLFPLLRGMLIRMTPPSSLQPKLRLLCMLWHGLANSGSASHIFQQALRL